MTNELVNAERFAANLQPVEKNRSVFYWRLCFDALITDGAKDDFLARHHNIVTATANNPYLAVVAATSYVLRYGNFRGYEHFASVYFDPNSRFYTGVTVHRERTRTHIDVGRYVTDWYIKVDKLMERDEFEQMYRAAVGILVSAQLDRGPPFRSYLIGNTFNVRMKNDGNQTPFITSN